jgi:hypothetical protein
MLWDKYFGSSLAGEKRHCDGSLVGGVAVSRVSCTSNSAIAAMTPTPGERPVGPAAVEGRPVEQVDDGNHIGFRPTQHDAEAARRF